MNCGLESVYLLLSRVVREAPRGTHKHSMQCLRVASSSILILRTPRSPKHARSAMCMSTYNTTLSQHPCFGGTSSPPSTRIDGKESPQHAVLHSTVTVVTTKVSAMHMRHSTGCGRTQVSIPGSNWILCGTLGG